MKFKGTLIVILIALALGGGLLYRFTHLRTGGEEEGHAEHAESESAGGHKEAAKGAEEHGGEEHGEHEEAGAVHMPLEVQQKQGLTVVAARKEKLAGVIAATGKVEVNADRIAHVSPRIPGKIVSVGANLGDTVKAGASLARLDSVELGEAINRYQQSRTRVALAEKNLERVRLLVEKKIAARKEIFAAESEYQSARAELHADRERLQLYGLAPGDLTGANGRRALLPVRSPIGGVVTEKHAIVGELANPEENLFTVADLSTVWVLVDINEKDLGRVRPGQSAQAKVVAFPDEVFKGKITYLADVLDETTRTLKARVEVQNPGRKLKPEMFATVELALPDEAPPVLAIPEEALQELEGKKVLFVTADGTEFMPRPVELGRAAGGLVEVTGGLKEGEKYAAKGSFLLKSELKKGELGEHGH